MTFREIEKWSSTVPNGWFICETQTWLKWWSKPSNIDSRNGEWDVFEYTVMPTHIHLFCELGRKGLKTTLEDFKRWTGHQAAKITHRLTASDSGKRREWFDHWSRSDLEDERIAAYIRNNPVKAGLVTDAAEWRYSSVGRRK